jgi:hypothetical protein
MLIDLVEGGVNFVDRYRAFVPRAVRPKGAATATTVAASMNCICLAFSYCLGGRSR